MILNKTNAKLNLLLKLCLLSVEGKTYEHFGVLSQVKKVSWTLIKDKEKLIPDKECASITFSRRRERLRYLSKTV